MEIIQLLRPENINEGSKGEVLVLNELALLKEGKQLFTEFLLL